MWSNLIADKARYSPVSWVIGGDFNIVLSSSEKRGRNQRYSEVESQDFGHFTGEMGVINFPFLSKKFSWFQPNDSAASRLDSILVSQELIDR